jgi:retinol dehydrogenase-14
MSRPFALITGSTDGIGLATATRLARDGWDVGVVGRNADKVALSVEAVRAAAPAADVRPWCADLSRMDDVAALARDVTATVPRLDLLLLNANHITQRPERTDEGFDRNLAIGFYGRALLASALDPLLRTSPGSLVMGVVGLNLERFDLDHPPGSFSSMSALGRWQWAIQVYARAWTSRSPVPFATFQPGLVRTKILADEPQPMRLVVQIANRIIGIRPEQSAGEVATVVEALRREPASDVYYSRTKRKGRRELGEQPGDVEAVWSHAARALARWRATRGG